MNKNYREKIMKIFEFAIKLMALGIIMFMIMCIYMAINITDGNSLYECIRSEAFKMLAVTTPVVLLATITYGLFIVYDYHITEEKEKAFMSGLGLLILIFLVKAFAISFFDEKYISELRALFDNIMTGVISASLVALFRC